MTIGPDILEVLAEVGSSVTIIRDSGNVTGEYIQIKPNAQVTKPFIREFFLEAMMSYVTAMIPGDIIEVNTTGERYIIMNKTPDMFEDAVIRYGCVLYKTNKKVDILRPVDTRDPDTYWTATGWQMIKGNADVLFTAALFGNDLETDEELAVIGVSEDEVYLPSSWGVQPLDRIRFSSSEFYRVEVIKKRRFAEVDMLEVGEDTRPPCSTTTTTTTSSTTTTTA